MMNCDKCGKEFRLRFRPKKGLPVYCKACYRQKKPAQEFVSEFDKIEDKEQKHLKEKIEKIESELEEVKQEKLEEQREVEESIETEISETSQSMNGDNEELPQINVGREPAFEEEAEEESENNNEESNEDENEEAIEEKIETSGDDFSLDSVGVYNPDEGKEDSVENLNYSNDAEKEISDVF